VIEAEKASQIYAGLRSGTTAGILRESLDDGTIADHLVGITPKPGDAVFIPGEQFTPWATMSWFSRFSRIAIRLFGFTIGVISTR